MRKVVAVLLIFLGIFSCKFWEEKPENVVASYKNHSLTSQQIKAIVPNDISRDDSITLANKYIEEWLKDKIFFETVKDSLNENAQLEIEEKVEKYRNDLLLSSVEEHLYSQLKKDSVTKDEIEEYYEQNQPSFVANQDWVEYKYLMVPKDSVSEYRVLFHSDDLAKQSELKKRVKKYNYPNQLEDNIWIEFETLKTTVPFPNIANNAEFLRRTQNLTLKENEHIYLVKLLNYKGKGDTSPLPIVKGTIKNVLVNKRKLNLLSKYKNELYENALQNGDIEKK